MVEQHDQAAILGRSINLADPRLGAAALFCSDDFFAPMSRMLNPAEPEWRAGVYDDHGKWMDGWESRRRRDGGHDFCVVQLAVPCTLALLDIDTRHFTGNYPPFASLEGCLVIGKPDGTTQWTELLSRAPLQGNEHNWFEVQSGGVWSHLRLNIYPDGGIARLRCYGSVYREWTQSMSGIVDLAAALNGGRALLCSDEHYGAMSNLLLPGRGTSMADGWETRRRRGPGFDWVILRLGHPGRIDSIEVDTAFFRGNYPHEVSIEGAMVCEAQDADVDTKPPEWSTLLPPQRLQADQVHAYQAQLVDLGAISHVRVNIHPDGGLSRVRLFGRPDVR